MAFDEALGDRIRDALGKTRGIVEKKMFGGLVFMLDGHMLVGIWKDSLIARIGAEEAMAALEESHVGVFDVTGRPMKGWVLVDPDGLDEDRQVKHWIQLAMRFVDTLPPK